MNYSQIFYEDESGNKKLQITNISIVKEYFKKLDKYSNCELSRDIDYKNFTKIKEIFNIKDCSNRKVLRIIAFHLKDPSFKSVYDIDENIAIGVMDSAINQLDLMGASTFDLV